MTLNELRQWVIDQTEDEPEVRKAFDRLTRRLELAEAELLGDDEPDRDAESDP
jgi:hypothetical protein